MDKTITLDDLQDYFQEIDQIEHKVDNRRKKMAGPSKMALHNLLSYSRALVILKTESAGTIFHLAN